MAFGDGEGKGHSRLLNKLLYSWLLKRGGVFPNELLKAFLKLQTYKITNVTHVRVIHMQVLQPSL